MRLSIPQLKGQPGFETISDEEAKEIIETLFQISLAFYELYSQQKKNKNECRTNKRDSCIQTAKEA